MILLRHLFRGVSAQPALWGCSGMKKKGARAPFFVVSGNERGRSWGGFHLVRGKEVRRLLGNLSFHTERYADNVIV